MRDSPMQQVVLERGGAKQVGWIPSEAAVVGYSVELKDADNVFWNVVEVFSTRVGYAELRENERNYKDHRKATDI